MPLPFILVRGQHVPMVGDGQCVLPSESKLEFIPGRDKCMARNTQPTLITLHDTAGEGTGPAIYRNLINRSVSVHFAVDRAGVIYQYCDPAVVTAYHMGPANSRSIGIEMANAVFPFGIKPGTFAWAKKLVLTGHEKLYGRQVVEDDYRGKKRRVLGHFDAQKKAVTSLVATLLREFPAIPKRIPPLSPLRGPDVTLPPFRVGGVRLDPDWQGVASHLHFTDGHVDPAGDIYEAFRDLLTP